MTRPRALFALAIAVALAASLALAVLTFIDVPIGQDGSWYSYPAYDWSQGGDPSENIPVVDRTVPPPPREVVKFGWENRSNLTVLLTRLWFGIAEPSWITLKAFGLLQLALLAVLVTGITVHLTGNRTLAIFSFCIVLSDPRVLQQALASARPDLFIADFSLGLLWLILVARTSGSWTTWASAVLLAICLPMLHSTAANAIAFLVVFLGLAALADRTYFQSSRSVMLGLTLAPLLVVVFFCKQPVLDVLVPTHVPLSAELPYRHDLVHELRSIIDAGLPAKISMELHRWRDYFFMGGVAQFLTIVTGFVLAVVLAGRRRESRSIATALALFAAFLCAVASMFVFDSHSMVPHALVVAIFGYVGSVALLGAARRVALVAELQLLRGGASLLLIAGLASAAHAARLYQEYRVAGVTNAAEQAALLKALPPVGDVRVIGPTELWPYLAQRRQPLLLIDDDRARFSRYGGRRPEQVDPNYAGAEYLVVNKELYTTWHWDQMIHDWQTQQLITPVSRLGDCARTIECLLIYEFVTRPQPG